MLIGKLDCYRACFSLSLFGSTSVRKSIDCGKLFGKITHLAYGFCFGVEDSTKPMIMAFLRVCFWFEANFINFLLAVDLCQHDANHISISIVFINHNQPV